MARDLADVVDFFLPPSQDEPRRAQTPRLPTLVLPIGDRDVLRAALAWNLAVELARLDAQPTVVTRHPPHTSLLWPDSGRGPLGAELVHAASDNYPDLVETTLGLAREPRRGTGEGGIVLLCAPPEWVRGGGDSATPGWALLFTTAESNELRETYALMKSLVRRDPSMRIGITIHGARGLDDARRAFEHLSDVAERHLQTMPVSYGLLVDDLHVYRAIVARRPIGLEHPQSPAARALRDVARLILEDAGSAP